MIMYNTSLHVDHVVNDKSKTGGNGKRNHVSQQLWSWTPDSLGFLLNFQVSMGKIQVPSNNQRWQREIQKNGGFNGKIIELNGRIVAFNVWLLEDIPINVPMFVG